MKKRMIGLFVVSLVLISVFVISFVSAQILPADLNPILDGVRDIFGLLLGEVSGGGGEIIFVKLLVFTIILSIVFLAVQRVPGFGGRNGLSFIISLAVSLISVRYLTTASLINFIWLPYGVVGVLLSSFFPFIIGFFFLQGFDSSVIRKVGWTGFLVIFVGLGWMRWNDFTASVWFKNLALIYVVIAAISLLLLWFDKTIHSWFVMATIERKGQEINALNINQLQQQIQQWRQVIANPVSTPAQIDGARRNIKDIERRIRN